MDILGFVAAAKAAHVSEDSGLVDMTDQPLDCRHVGLAGHTDAGAWSGMS